MKALPKEVFVAWNRDEAGSDDGEWLQANVTAEDIQDGPEWRTVGVYKLVKTIKVRERTEVETK